MKQNTYQPKFKTNKKKKHRNMSTKIKLGTTLQTRDEYFAGQKNYRKPGYENSKNYRKTVVVDSNKRDELAVVKLTTAKKAMELPNYQKGKSRFNAYILTKNDDFKPIKIGKKFTKNKSKLNMSKHDVNYIKRISLKETSGRLRKTNKKRLRKLKDRK